MRQNQLCFKEKSLLVQTIGGQTKSIFTGRLTRLLIIVVNIAEIEGMGLNLLYPSKRMKNGGLIYVQ